MSIYHVMALLICLNIVLNHGFAISCGFYWLHHKVVKPKYKLGEIVFVKGELFEIVHISEKNQPYSYFCLPLNKNSANLSNYYPQKEIKPLSALSKALF